MLTTGRRTIVRAALLSLVLVAIPLSLSAQDPRPCTPLNSSGDDYAACFHVLPGSTEVWLTTSRGAGEPRSRRIMSLSLSTRGGGPSPAPSPVNQGERDDNPVILDGCPAFSFCDSTAIIASNRLYGGKDYGNDLYELRMRDGTWAATRINNVNSEAWDDTPSLSEDGRFLYFASDRRRPGERLTDIYLSTRTSDGWSSPTLLDSGGVNTEAYAEQTPFVSSDGWLYYATNQTAGGDYDIWRVRLDGSTGRPRGKGEPITFTGVNRTGSDEGHPVISDGGNWLVFSSNRGPTGMKDFDLYQTPIPGPAGGKLWLKVQLRTRVLNPYTQGFDDRTIGTEATGSIVDLQSRDSVPFTSNAQGDVQIDLPSYAGKEPIDDQRTRAILIRANAPTPQFISAVDTVVFDVNCLGQIEHSLFIWDTAVYYNPVCRQDFPVTNVQFFITGYWCPTTIRYRDFASCTSVLGDEACVTVASERPELSCSGNELFTYQLNYAPPTITTTRTEGACVNMDEARRRGAEFALKVDMAIDQFIENMRAALQAPCVQRAMTKGEPVKVEVTGWTDPRPIHRHCLYTGPDIDMASGVVRLESMEEKPYIRSGILPSMTPFRESGANGNQLLSELRAYYTARLLDSVWSDRIPEYRRLRNGPLGRFQLIAIGNAVNMKDIPFEQRRSVNVVVTTPIDEEIGNGKLPPPGSASYVCGDVCYPRIVYHSGAQSR